jgi:hypothetical protein
VIPQPHGHSQEPNENGTRINLGLRQLDYDGEQMISEKAKAGDIKGDTQAESAENVMPKEQNLIKAGKKRKKAFKARVVLKAEKVSRTKAVPKTKAVSETKAACKKKKKKTKKKKAASKTKKVATVPAS